MRNLAAGTMYLWHVHEGTCAATGAPVPGWTYRKQVGANGTLTANKSGNANTRGKSATFNADPAKRYSVNVHVATPTNGLPAGTIIACGDLSASKAGGKSKPKSHTRRTPRARSRNNRQAAGGPAGAGPPGVSSGVGRARSAYDETVRRTRCSAARTANFCIEARATLPRQAKVAGERLTAQL